MDPKFILDAASWARSCSCVYVFLLVCGAEKRDNGNDVMSMMSWFVCGFTSIYIFAWTKTVFVWQECIHDFSSFSLKNVQIKYIKIYHCRPAAARQRYSTWLLWCGLNAGGPVHYESDFPTTTNYWTSTGSWVIQHRQARNPVQHL